MGVDIFEYLIDCTKFEDTRKPYLQSFVKLLKPCSGYLDRCSFYDTGSEFYHNGHVNT